MNKATTIMCCKRNLAAITLIIAAFIPQIASGDGGFVVDNPLVDVHAPDQKVAIAWDGTTETMILSTKVQSDELANFGWIIPVKSKEKPEVEFGDVGIFYALRSLFTYFPVYVMETMGVVSGGLQSDSIEILETKELDIYDIVMLRATDSEQLYNWLKTNNFKIEESSKEIISSYTNEDFFFVTVKIDLLNEHRDDIRLIERQDSPADANNVNGKKDEAIPVLLLDSTEESLIDFLVEDVAPDGKEQSFIDLIAEDILSNKPYDQSLASKNAFCKQYDLLPRQKYDELRKEYGSAVSQDCSALKADLEEHLCNNESVKHLLSVRSRVNEAKSRVDSTIRKLESGLYKPLKISFKTNEAFFPLRI